MENYKMNYLTAGDAFLIIMAVIIALWVVLCDDHEPPSGW